MNSDVESKRRGRDVERGKRGGLRVVHTLALVGLGVVGVIVAFWVLSFIAGIVWGIVKVAIIVAVVGGVLWFLLRRRH